MPTEKREWSLTKSMKCENPSGENAIKVRQCPNCYKVYEPKTRQCPYCNYIAEPTPREIKQEEQAELERIQKVEKYQRKNEIWQCKTYGELVAYAREHNYKNPRADGVIIYYKLEKRKGKNNMEDLYYKLDYDNIFLYKVTNGKKEPLKTFSDREAMLIYIEENYDCANLIIMR